MGEVDADVAAALRQLKTGNFNQGQQAAPAVPVQQFQRPRPPPPQWEPNKAPRLGPAPQGVVPPNAGALGPLVRPAQPQAAPPAGAPVPSILGARPTAPPPPGGIAALPQPGLTPLRPAADAAGAATVPAALPGLLPPGFAPTAPGVGLPTSPPNLLAGASLTSPVAGAAPPASSVAAAIAAAAAAGAAANKITETMEIPQTSVGVLIGKQASTINAIKTYAKAHCFVEQHTPTEDKAKVTIIGSVQEVDVCKKVVSGIVEGSLSPQVLIQLAAQTAQAEAQ
ncbi:unnamed protein product, partial [Symbiodinium sp. CCMP2456]